jgi:hypothetical protein
MHTLFKQSNNLFLNIYSCDKLNMVIGLNLKTFIHYYWLLLSLSFLGVRRIRWSRHKILFVYGKGLLKFLYLALTVYNFKHIAFYNFHKIILITSFHTIGNIPIFANIFACLAAKFF